MLRALAEGFGHQVLRFVREGKFALLLALLLGGTWLSIDVYRYLVVIDAPVAVLDFDNSALSRTLRTYLDATREVRVVADPTLGEAAARKALVEGTLAGVVVLPEGLSARVKRGDHATVVVAVDMSNILVGKNTYKAVSTAVSTVSAGVLITQLRKLGVRKEMAFASAVPVSIDEYLPLNPSTNYAVYLVPILAFALLHVFLLIVVGSLFLPSERPPSTVHLLGALLASALLTFAVGALFLWVYLPALGVLPQSGPRVLVANLGALIGLDVLFAAAVARVVPRPLTAFQLTVIVAMLSLMFAGVTWPPDMFPPVFRAISEWMPFTPFARALRILLGTRASFSDVAPALGQYVRLAAGYAVALGISTGFAWLVARLRRVHP